MLAPCYRKVLSSLRLASAGTCSRWLRQSYLAGGHVRVGMEDGIYLRRGVLAPSNAAMVAKIRGVAEALGASIATSAQARDMLGLQQRAS